MSEIRNRRQTLAFERWWDRQIGGKDARHEQDLDRGLEAFARRVHSLDERLPDNPTYKQQLWEELMSQATLASAPPLRPSANARPTAGHRDQVNPERTGGADIAAPRWHWRRGPSRALAQLATAALVLVTLLGIVRIAIDHRVPRSGPHGVIVPATSIGCGSRGGSSMPAGSPVALDIWMATPGSTTDPSVSFVWESTSMPAEVKLISHLTIDPQCRLWVMDHAGSRFLIFDLDGNFLETWGSPGDEDGQFNFGDPSNQVYNGIAFAPDSGFYVSDLVNRRVQQFDKDRQFVRSWSTAVGSDAWTGVPRWIATGPDGNVYVVVDTDVGIVQVFSPDGVLIRKFGSITVGPGHLNRAGPIAFDPAGNLWVLDPLDGTLVQFSTSGEQLAKLDPEAPLPYSLGLAIDSTGRFIVTDIGYDNVSVFDPNGVLLFSWGATGLGEGEFLNPFSIALDGNGGLYISDIAYPRFQKFQIHSPAR